MLSTAELSGKDLSSWPAVHSPLSALLGFVEQPLKSCTALSVHTGSTSIDCQLSETSHCRCLSCGDLCGFSARCEGTVRFAVRSCCRSRIRQALSRLPANRARRSARRPRTVKRGAQAELQAQHTRRLSRASLRRRSVLPVLSSPASRPHCLSSSSGHCCCARLPGSEVIHSKRAASRPPLNRAASALPQRPHSTTAVLLGRACYKPQPT